MHESSPAQLAICLETVLQGVIRRDEPYALLDFPAYPNIGDSAIWLGEIELLTKIHSRRPAYVSHLRYPPSASSRVISERGVLYLQGGGNFGDLWPHHQRYREAVIAANPHRRIVQLPQSIHYHNPLAAESARRTIGSHPDFHLMVRDRESAEFARKELNCSVTLAPDSAFAIDLNRRRSNKEPRGILAHLRNDKERRKDAEMARCIFSDVPVSDWAKERKASRMIQKGLLGLFLAVPPTLPKKAPQRLFTSFAAGRVAVGFDQLDAACVVVTDRLHGHILAELLGKPHVVIDNMYGKISRFIDLWGASNLTHRAVDYREAREIADRLLQGAS